MQGEAADRGSGANRRSDRAAERSACRSYNDVNAVTVEDEQVPIQVLTLA